MLKSSDNNRDQVPYSEKPAAAECGALHSDCPNSWKGSCDREAGHDGSHHCDKCNSAF